MQHPTLTNIIAPLENVAGHFGSGWIGQEGRVWVNRVDIAMSASSSAIHNTGHHHVRARPVSLSPACGKMQSTGFAGELGVPHRSRLRAES
jgi:hypothetical protein